MHVKCVVEDLKNFATALLSDYDGNGMGEAQSSHTIGFNMRKGTIYIQDLRPGVYPSLKISSQRHAQSQRSARLGGTISTAMTSWKRAERRWQ